MEELSRDSAGNLLPRIFLDSNFNIEGIAPSEEEFRNRTSFWSLTRDPSADQESRRLQLGNFLLIYVCNFHVLNHFFLIYTCKLHWNLDQEYSNALEAAKESGEELSTDAANAFIFNEAPEGDLRDPLLCKAFELTERLLVQHFHPDVTVVVYTFPAAKYMHDEYTNTLILNPKLHPGPVTT